MKRLFLVVAVAILACAAFSCGGGDSPVVQGGEPEDDLPKAPEREGDSEFVKGLKKQMKYVTTFTADDGSYEIDRFSVGPGGNVVMNSDGSFIVTKDAVAEYGVFDEHFFKLYDIKYENGTLTSITVANHPVGCCQKYTAENYKWHCCGLWRAVSSDGGGAYFRQIAGEVSVSDSLRVWGGRLP